MNNENVVFEKKNVLVTGGAGFIGSHLCEELLKEARVICMDNFINSSAFNIDHLLPYDDFEFVKHDVSVPFKLTDFPEIEKFAVEFQGVQEIYHLACPTSPKNFDKLKIETLQANSLAMNNTLELARQYKAKYLFASSSVVYGSPPPDPDHRFKEDDEGVVDHISGRACYDEGKRFAETYIDTYRQVYNLDVQIARMFRVYGPRMQLREGHLIPDFIIDALDGGDLVIYGDEKFSTSLSYVSDVVDALLRLMHLNGYIGPVNIGDDKRYLMSEIAQKIIEMTNSSSQIKYEPPLEFLTQLGLPDLTKAREELGWVPLVRLEDGLRKTIDYTVANKDALGVGK
ncbi:hypothetical protein A3H75_03410 [Candidatus Uhrbacteria bacterium RIFCSPLOWO2_02_FULL_51_9]|uniref:NAD-dependent epimerase/dehydratase domain-containing protein n=1 Tax=Candidatus Uhrbacteria bacterium RIFCSPLOWO2_02_FULL_51_9 TaxID=1802410 RepID=A0A1F7VD54_9BACT|nr:MAG: hypothetical protein A3H75_03410 [Candidatus Uhrbacteria bacterium RIFCSPLOWO2_02_FULL_51_9]